MKLRTALFSFVMFATAIGCSTTSSSSNAPAARPADDTPRPVLALDDVDRAKPSSCDEHWLAGSTGRVTTDRGEVLVGATVAYCAYSKDLSLCLPWVKTEKGGWYSIVVDEEHRCLAELSIRVIPPEGRRLSDVYCTPSLSPTSSGVLELSDLRVFTLNAPKKLPPLGDSSKTRTVAFDDGLELTFAPDDLAEGDQYEKLSAGPVNDLERPCFLPAGVTMDALYAFGPAMNVSVFADKPKVRFKLPNPKGLSEGTEVEIFALGGSGSQIDVDHPLAEGAFESVGLGHVEGGLVVPDSGALPVLSVVGYRRR
jgi:hypothetical protein